MRINLKSAFLALLLFSAGAPAQEQAASDAARDDAFQEAAKLFERGRFSEAEAIYTHLLSSRPNDPDALYNAGTAQLRRGKFRSASITFQRMADTAPGDVDAWLALGIVFRQRGDLDRAVQSLKQAVQIAPKDARAHYCLSLVYTEKDWPDKAALEIELAGDLPLSERAGLAALKLRPPK